MNQNTAVKKLSIFVVTLTLAILSCSGIQDIPGLLATETPTPTNTFTPSPTVTPSPTATQTQTPAPTGIITEVQSDGSTFFIDYDNKYQMVFPKDWVVIPLKAKDLARILKDLSEKNPAFESIATSFAQLDPNIIRVIAVHSDSKYVLNGFSTNLTTTAIEDTLLSAMPIDFVTGTIEESLKQQGATLLSNDSFAKNNANGVEIGTFDFQQTAPTATGAKIPVRSKTIIFQTNGKVIMIQLAVPRQFAEELLPVLDEISDSIKLIKP